MTDLMGALQRYTETARMKRPRHEDEQQSAVHSEWQRLYAAHFHPVLPGCPPQSPPSSPCAASSSLSLPPAIPRFFFASNVRPPPPPAHDTAFSSSSASPPPPPPAAGPSASAAFRTAALSLHLQRVARTLLTDDDLSALYHALCKAVQLRQSISVAELSSSFSSSASLTATSLSLSYSSMLQAPLDSALSYAQFLQLGQSLAPAKRAAHFNSRTFALFPRSGGSSSSIPSRLLLLHLLYSSVVSKLRLSLSAYDELGQGFLREEDLMNFVFDDLSNAPALRAVDADFAPYFVFTVVRKFLFFLDPHRRGRIRIHTLAHSSLMHEWEHRKKEDADLQAADSGLAQLRQALVLAASTASAAGEMHVGQTALSSSLFSCTDPGRVSSSSSPRPCWFSLLNSQAVYGLYLSLDKNQNGMLSKDELSAFHGGSFTSALMDALFSSLPLYPSAADPLVLEMDYKAFLDFVLALEYPHSCSSLAYFFALLDQRGAGFLDRACMSFWFRHVRERLMELGHEGVPPCDTICDEILDMVAPLSSPGRISLHDLQRSSCGHTVVSILTDVNGFWKYDHRETLMAQQQQQQQQPH